MASNEMGQFPGRGNQEKNSDNTSSERSSSQEQDVNVTNPQRGSEWSNYQTKELSTNEEGNISAEEAAEAFDEEE